MFENAEDKDALFNRYGVNWCIELIQSDRYKGILSKHDIISIFFEETLKIANKNIEEAFAETLSVYYQKVEISTIPSHLKPEAIKETIKENRNLSTSEYEITRKKLFSL